MDCRVKPGNDDGRGALSRPPATSAALLEDAKVKVTRFDFVPGAETGWHRHAMDYVIVPMTPCHFLLEEPGGTRNADMQAGAVYRRNAGVEHNVINAGSVPMSFIEIELKPQISA
jgi:quercetin dioxygenase-like cupin family protein